MASKPARSHGPVLLASTRPPSLLAHPSLNPLTTSAHSRSSHAHFLELRRAAERGGQARRQGFAAAFSSRTAIACE
jgi:hypothetical protein